MAREDKKRRQAFRRDTDEGESEETQAKPELTAKQKLTKISSAFGPPRTGPSTEQKMQNGLNSMFSGAKKFLTKMVDEDPPKPPKRRRKEAE